MSELHALRVNLAQLFLLSRTFQIAAQVLLSRELQTL